jgi:GH43 family beta-xylosidase
MSEMIDPLTPTGDRVMLSQPEFTWEKVGGTPTINEAPQFIAHDDKMFIIYSASGCWTDDYTLGMLTADASADLMDPASWTKVSTPVFTKNPSGQAYGPGHNSFFTSPDGTEDWILYHANAFSGEGCGDDRSTRMQKFTWDSNGNPNFGAPVALGSKVEKPSGDL